MAIRFNFYSNPQTIFDSAENMIEILLIANF